MANPATAFSLYDPSMGEGMAQPAERLPENGLSPLPPIQAERVTERGFPINDPHGIGPLQQVVIDRILATLAEPRPETKWSGAFRTYDVFSGAPTREQRDWEARQQSAARQIQALNAMTGAQNAGWNADRSARGWAGLGIRQEGLDQGDERIRIAKDREARLAFGPAVKFETMDDNGLPQTMMGNQLPGGQGILLTDGQVIHPTAFPKPFRLTPLQGMNEFANYNPFTGQTQGTVMGQGGEPFRPPLPPGVAQDVIANRASAGSIEQLKGAFDKYKGSALPATAQKAIQLGGEKFPGITKDVTGALGMEDEYTRQISFIAEFNRALTDYINAKSGKQYSYMEFLRFQPQFPNIATDNDTTFANKISSLMSTIERSYGLTVKLYPGSVRALGAGEVPHATPAGAADDNTPERQYGPETTNTGDKDDMDAQYEEFLRKRNASKS